MRVLPGGNSYISQQGRRCWIGQICEGVIVVHHVASKHARTQLPVIGGDLAGPRFLGMCKVRNLAAPRAVSEVEMVGVRGFHTLGRTLFRKPATLRK